MNSIAIPGREFRATTMDAMIYIANGLNLMSYFVRDILHLRGLTVVAVACLAMYFVSRPEPLMEVVYWNLFFLVLNVLQIARLVLLRRREPTRGSSVAAAKVSSSATVHAPARQVNIVTTHVTEPSLVRAAGEPPKWIPGVRAFLLRCTRASADQAGANHKT